MGVSGVGVCAAAATRKDCGVCRAYVGHGQREGSRCGWAAFGWAIAQVWAHPRPRIVACGSGSGRIAVYECVPFTMHVLSVYGDTLSVRPHRRVSHVWARHPLRAPLANGFPLSVTVTHVFTREPKHVTTHKLESSDHTTHTPINT